MKIIHAPFCFYPDPIGGTEVYVESLVRNLQKQGTDNIVVVPGKKNEESVYNGILIRRFAVSQSINDLREIYGEGEKEGAIQFARILEEEKPDLFHLHAFTRDASLRLVQAAKQRQIPTIFTYHTPTVSCVRGTLMYLGETVCGGQLDRVQCTRCVLHANGLSPTISKLLSTIPPSLSAQINQRGLQGKVWTALRMSELIALRHTATHALFAEVAHVVVVANWIREVLLCNGVPEQKLTLCRHGLAHANRKSDINQTVQVCKQLRLVFLGRLDETKGLDIVLQAFQMLPNASITLDIYGIQQEKEKTPYQQKLLKWIEKDGRVRLHPPVASEQVISLLQNYDSLVVPSRWLETGPLVVLEAFASGIPVIGSKLGGIAEWVEDNVNGLLVEVDSPSAWAKTLERLIDNPKLVVQLASNITTPRTMDVVASEMLALYKTIVNANKI